MTDAKYLIVNADDFGRSRSVNRGIMSAYEYGIVTSASLMVRWPAANEATAYARRHQSLSVGLHFDFGEWCYRNGGQMAEQLDYVPMPESVVKMVEQAWQQIKGPDGKAVWTGRSS